MPRRVVDLVANDCFVGPIGTTFQSAAVPRRVADQNASRPLDRVGFIAQPWRAGWLTRSGRARSRTGCFRAQPCRARWLTRSHTMADVFRQMFQSAAVPRRVADLSLASTVPRRVADSYYAVNGFVQKFQSAAVPRRVADLVVFLVNILASKFQSAAVPRRVADSPPHSSAARPSSTSTTCFRAQPCRAGWLTSRTQGRDAMTEFQSAAVSRRVADRSTGSRRAWSFRFRAQPCRAG